TDQKLRVCDIQRCDLTNKGSHGSSNNLSNSQEKVECYAFFTGFFLKFLFLPRLKHGNTEREDDQSIITPASFLLPMNYPNQRSLKQHTRKSPL
ncbi:hypothetical protein M8C21_001889, partial [Ambrosia artemisiifolia]